MAYKVVVTNDAKENMQKYIEYILYEKKNQQAAASLLDDFEYTKDILAEVNIINAENHYLINVLFKVIIFIFRIYLPQNFKY